MSSLPNVSVMHSLDGFTADAGITINVGDTTLVLDAKCPECRGAGEFVNAGKCRRCQGRKTVPSPEGVRLLAFFRKYLTPEDLRDARSEVKSTQ